MMEVNRSSSVQAIQRGTRGAVAAAHPLAVAAGLELLESGGSAADAAIAAQAVLCVLMPDACGLGGDMLALLRQPDATTLAINGAGSAPAGLRRVGDDGPDSIAVPGLVDGWCVLSARAGRLPLARVLAPALKLARAGITVSPTLAGALMRHHARLLRGGADSWVLFDQVAGARVVQSELAALLERIGADGRAAFYAGDAARRIAGAVHALGGTLSETDLATHATPVGEPLSVYWGDWQLHVQPPMTQGVLLAVAVQAWERLGVTLLQWQDHIGVELTQAAFAYRDEVASGRLLMEQPVPIDMQRASNRGGPRAYLHTAGVAVADNSGMVVSSLVSVFDDFGSAVYVPGLGITLNNRCGGFTQAANAAAAGKRPVHTLAPVLLERPDGVLALATPGADGQVQTLLQVLAALRLEGVDIAQAIARPRWRSESGRLLIEHAHAGQSRLVLLGHRLVPLDDGDMRFGAVVCAGLVDGSPVAAADWRRETAAGVV